MCAFVVGAVGSSFRTQRRTRVSPRTRDMSDGSAGSFPSSSGARMTLAAPAAAPKPTDGSEPAQTLLPGVLHKIETPETFDLLLASAGDRPIVADFMASWCRKCLYLVPRLRKLAEEYPETYYCTVDVNKVARLPREYKIAKMPTFIFIRNGEVLESYIGADEAPVVSKKLRDRVAQYSDSA